MLKLKYEKPMLAVEYFELTQSIAACVTNIGFMSSDCVKNDPDATEQMQNLAWSGCFSNSGCDYYPEGMDVYDSICYHTNVNAAFSS